MYALLFPGVIFAAVLLVLDLAARRFPARTLFGPSPGGRTQTLDGLRGALAIGVVFHHAAVHRIYWGEGRWAPPTTWVLAQLGPIPVLFFFVLSGFLFWTQLQKAGTPFPVFRFWLARVRRIFPAYVLSVAMIVGVSFVFAGFARRESLPTLLAHIGRWLVLGAPNLDFPAINRAVGLDAVNASVQWTLYYECLFYLALPALLWFRRGHRALPLLAGFGAAYLLVRHSGFVPAAGDAHAWLPILKTFLTYLATGFGVGIFASYVQGRIAAPPWIRQPWASVGLLACLATVLFGFENAMGPGPVIAQRALVLAFFYGVANDNDLFGILTMRGAQVLGRVSYSLYLLHGFALYAVFAAVNPWYPVREMGDVAFWSVAAGGVALAVALAAVSARFVEMPFWKHGATVAKTKGAKGVGAARAAAA